jgi:hypothetical protein
MAETAAQKKARLAAAAKEATYINSFGNPITSQYDPRIAKNAGLDPERIGRMTGSGQTPEEAAAAAAKKVEDSTAKPKAGTIIKYKSGTKTGYRIPVYADGAGGEFDGEESPDPAYSVGDDGDDGDGGDGGDPILDIAKRESQSAYDLLYLEFAQYGMGSLVEPLKEFIQQGLNKAEFTLRLRDTEQYRKRFAANAKRVANGYTALNEASYIGLEDQYQNVMRNYGLPESYYKRGDLGRQEGFEKLIGFDVDSVELEDRILTAQDRVLKSNPEVLDSLKKFYPEINNGDILAYVLDPVNGKDVIKRKVTAAEIGSGAMQAKLNITGQRAEELGAAGVNKSTAQEGFNVIGGGLERGSQLASIYGENPYTQTTAETEVFKLQGSTEARKQRQKVTGLEEATFGKKTGVSSSALLRDRAGAY